MTIYSIFLILHIIAGFTALIVGAINIIGKKGKKLHFITGQIFFWSMLNVSISAIVMSCMKSNNFLLHIGIFVLYMNVAGFRSVKDKSLVPNALDIVLLVAAIVNASIMFSTADIILIVFASISTSLSINDIRYYHTIYKKKSLPAMTWLRRHIGMMLGSYLSAFTAFLVVNINLGTYNWVVWLLPTAIITPLIVYWTNKYKRKRPKMISTTAVIVCLLFAGKVIANDLSNTNQQIVISGVVKNQSTNEVLPYVNIGVLGSSIGTVSAPDGSFQLFFTPDSSIQEIQFSHIGFEDKKLIIKELLNKNTTEVILIPSQLTLPSIEISSSKLERQFMGYDKFNTRMNVYFAIGKQPNQNLGAAIGKKFKVKKQVVRLDTLGFYIRQNNFDTVRFRINIHPIENGKPNGFLQNTSIIKEVTNQYKGFVEVDLTPYNLVLNQNFIVSIEWIYSSKKGKYLQMPIAMPVVGSTHYYRYGSQNKWKIFRGMSSVIYLKTQIE